MSKLSSYFIPLDESSNLTGLMLSRRLMSLSVAVLFTAMLQGCQPTKDTQKNEPPSQSTTTAATPKDSANSPTLESSRPSQVTLASEQAQSVITEYESIYIVRMLSLQQSQLAEYEALQAADTLKSTDRAFDSDTGSETSNNGEVTIKSPVGIPSNEKADTFNSTLDPTNTADNAIDSASTSEKADLDVNIEQNDNLVASLDELELPLVTSVVGKPEQSTAAEIATRYQVAMQSLYLPKGVPLATQSVDTLLSIATVAPEVFRQPELAQRLVLKMPALARLLKQYQVWEQIETQQSAELTALKEAQIKAQEAQAKEFETLVAEFDKVKKDYDKQISKYEKQLAKFE